MIRKKFLLLMVSVLIIINTLTYIPPLSFTQNHVASASTIVVDTTNAQGINFELVIVKLCQVAEIRIDFGRRQIVEQKIMEQTANRVVSITKLDDVTVLEFIQQQKM